MIKFRSHQRKDIPYRLKWWRNPKATKFLNDIPKKNTVETQNKWFDKYLKDEEKKFFTILFDNLPIGMVGLFDIDKINKSASVFIIIGDDKFHGQGVGKKAMNFIVNYGFKKLNLHKIKLGVAEKNIGAIKCYETVGFKKEGICKDEFLINGKYQNEILMAVFKHKKSDRNGSGKTSKNP